MHTAVEHSAVLHAAAWAARRRPRSRVDRARAGSTPATSSRRAARPASAWSPLQSANHEVGTLQPVGELAAAADDVPLFVDACASMGRLPLPDGLGGRRRLGAQVGRAGRASACCWSARAPAGATRSPATTGSTSASTGFENVPAALAAAAALQAVVAERDEVNARQHALVDRIRAGVAAESPTSRWSATRSTGSPTW